MDNTMIISRLYTADGQIKDSSYFDGLKDSQIMYNYKHTLYFSHLNIAFFPITKRNPGVPRTALQVADYRYNKQMTMKFKESSDAKLDLGIIFQAVVVDDSYSTTEVIAFVAGRTRIDASTTSQFMSMYKVTSTAANQQMTVIQDYKIDSNNQYDSPMQVAFKKDINNDYFVFTCGGKFDNDKIQGRPRLQSAFFYPSCTGGGTSGEPNQIRQFEMDMPTTLASDVLDIAAVSETMFSILIASNENNKQLWIFIIEFTRNCLATNQYSVQGLIQRRLKNYCTDTDDCFWTYGMFYLTSVPNFGVTFFSGEHTSYFSGKTLASKTFFITSGGSSGTCFPTSNEPFTSGNINNDYGSLNTQVFDYTPIKEELLSENPEQPYSNLRDLGITFDTSFGVTSFNAIGCTNWDTYTPVYSGTTTPIVLAYTFDPAKSSNFIQNIQLYLDGLKFPDPLCHPNEFLLVPSPASEIGLDQTTHSDSTVSIDFATKSLVTLYNPSRTFRSKFTIEARNPSTNYFLSANLQIIDVSFMCNPSNFIISEPSSFQTTINIVATASQISETVLFDQFVITPGGTSPCSDQPLKYAYLADNIGSVTLPDKISATSADPYVRSFDVDTTAPGNYTTTLYIKAYYDHLLLTSGSEMNFYSNIVTVNIVKKCDPSLFTFSTSVPIQTYYNVIAPVSMTKSPGHSFGPFIVSPSGIVGCTENPISYAFQGDNILHSGTSAPAITQTAGVSNSFDIITTATGLYDFYILAYMANDVDLHTFSDKITVNITRPHQCTPIDLPNPQPSAFVYSQEVSSSNQSFAINFMSLVSSSDPVCQDVTLVIESMVDNSTGEPFTNSNSQIAYSYPNFVVDTRMPLPLIMIKFRFINTHSSEQVIPGLSTLFLGATIQVKQPVPLLVNLVPIFEEPLATTIILIAYNPPTPNDVKYCVPKMIDFENNKPIIDNIIFRGPHSYWTSFDSENKCFNFKIGNESLQFYIGSFEIELRVRDDSIVVQTNKTYSIGIRIISEESLTPDLSGLRLNEKNLAFNASQYFNLTQLDEESKTNSSNTPPAEVLAWLVQLPENISEPIPIQDRKGNTKFVREWNGQIFEPMEAWIASIDQFGLMKIAFKQEFSNQFFKEITQEVLNITIDPYYSNPNAEKLAFNWWCTEFQETYMKIQLNFSNPLYVSYGGEDWVHVQVKRQEYFERKAYKEFLPQNYTMSKVLFSMMLNTTLDKTLASFVPEVVETFDFTVMLTFTATLIVQIGFSYLWGLINTLQMILYLPLLKVNLPKNVKLFYQILLPLANLELIPPEYSTELLFDISSQEDKPYSSVLEEMGYETHNVLLNMGSLYIYLQLFVFGLCVMAILKIFKHLYPGDMRFRKPYRNLKKILFWGSFLLLFTEGYMEILISAYLNTLSNITYTKSDMFSQVLSYILLFVQLGVLPGAFIYMLTRDQQTLLSKEPKLRMGVLYQGLKLDSKITLSNNFLQLIRRATFVLIVFCPFYEIPQTMQIMMVLYMCLFFNIYVGLSEPFKLRQKNNTELFNEVTIFYASMSLFFFTDFNPIVEMQNVAGWLIIGVVLANMLINWGLFLYQCLQKLYYMLKLKYLKHKQLQRHKQKKTKMQIKREQKVQQQQIQNLMIPAQPTEEELKINQEKVKLQLEVRKLMKQCNKKLSIIEESREEIEEESEDFNIFQDLNGPIPDPELMRDEAFALLEFLSDEETAKVTQIKRQYPVALMQVDFKEKKYLNCKDVTKLREYLFKLMNSCSHQIDARIQLNIENARRKVLEFNYN